MPSTLREENPAAAASPIRLSRNLFRMYTLFRDAVRDIIVAARRW
ncbi:hypothetical protein GCM10027262_16840 [Nocardia tengchongensis]